jgi:DNA uptake protein ComE-like DNA-binding protein
VAASPKKTEPSAEEWLIGESDSDPRRDSGAGAETSQWLVEPATDVNGDQGTAKAQPVTNEEEPPPPEDSFQASEPGEPELAPPARRESARAPAKTDQALKELRAENRELAKTVRNLQTELRVQAKEAKAEINKALKQREAEFKERLRSTEADLTKRFEAREETLRTRIDEAESALAGAQNAKTGSSKPRKRKAPRSKTALDLNNASFEDLRNLGLSVTQSARVIAYRDTRGGYESLDELDEIPGLPKGTRSSLRRQLTLSN